MSFIHHIKRRLSSLLASYHQTRCYCHQSAQKSSNETKNPVVINSVVYERDKWTNVNSRLIQLVGRNLHAQPQHPLNLVKQKIVRFMYSKFRNSRGNPLFSIYDNFSPIVTTDQNFDSILIPKDHPSRSKSDTYYINSNYVLRSQTSAHQHELIKTGLDNFIFVGDVYRKDEIDRNHYPVFHQVEGVKLFTADQLFYDKEQHDGLQLFESAGIRTEDKQESHTLEAVKLLEHSLKSTLIELFRHIFGKDVKYRWINSYFPFTHPSFELELNLNGEWTEMLGCGIMEQQLLKNAGAGEKVGWAFGLGLERLAMRHYEIPDIRLFWSKDTGFLNQFKVSDPNTPIKYKPISSYPQCVNDMAFWISEKFLSNDFYDLVRRTGGDMVEQVTLVDKFLHPKHNKTSHCYRIVYRHMDRTLTQKEVNLLHKKIAEVAIKEFGIELR